MSCNNEVYGDLFCTTTFKILDIRLENQAGWFWFSVFLAFILQFVANMLWLKNTQLARELLHEEQKKECKGRCFNFKYRDLRSTKMKESWLFNGLSSFVFILRILLLVGNNIFIFIGIMLGNIMGVWYTQATEGQDESHTAGDINDMLNKLCEGDCTQETLKIKVVIEKLAEAIRKSESVVPSSKDIDGEYKLRRRPPTYELLQL
jgi:hypothetical protein